jgi:hypothetical protein
MGSFWDNVNAGMKKAVEEGWTVVKDSAKIGKHRYHTYNLHRKAEKLFAEIGGVVYDMAKPPYENPLSRPEVLKLIEEIKKVEEETAAIEVEIAKTRKKEAAGGEGHEEKETAPSSPVPTPPPSPPSEEKSGEPEEEKK